MNYMCILVTEANSLLSYDLWQVLKIKHELYGCGRSEPSILKKIIR